MSEPSQPSQPQPPTGHRYPPARRLDLVERLPEHDPRFDVADPYRWLEDPASPESIGWLQAQDGFATHELANPGREHLRARLTELLAAGVVTAPAWRHGRQFFMRRAADQEHAVLITVDFGWALVAARARLLLTNRRAVKVANRTSAVVMAGAAAAIATR